MLYAIYISLTNVFLFDTFTYCNMTTIIALANASMMSHNYYLFWGDGNN